MKYRAICENHLYSKAYKKGKKAVMPIIAVYVLPDYRRNALMKAHPEKKYINRIGLTVGKKIGGAVQRNRSKRVLYAAFSSCLPKIPKGYDFVIVARTRILSQKSTQVAATICKQLSASGIWCDNV